MPKFWRDFGEILEGFWRDFSEKNLKERGATTTPLLSAECQIEKKSALKLDVARVLGVRYFGDKSATFLATKTKKYEKHCIKYVFMLL